MAIRSIRGLVVVLMITWMGLLWRSWWNNPSEGFSITQISGTHASPDLQPHHLTVVHSHDLHDHHNHHNHQPPSTTATMPNFLDTIKRSFVDVTVNKDKENAINTSEFLEAAESLTTLFGTPLHASPNAFQLLIPHFLDVLGSVAFQPVKNDMLGNIKV
jgi:hypothetical protein